MATWIKVEVGYELRELNSVFGYELAGLVETSGAWELVVFGKNDLVGESRLVAPVDVPVEYVLQIAELLLRRQFGCLI